MKHASIKRTQTLKSLLEQQANDPTKTSELQIKQESLDPSKIHLIPTPSQEQMGGAYCQTVQFVCTNEVIPAAPSLAKPISTLQNLIDKEIAKVAKLLSVNESELKAWADLHFEVPAKTILTLLRTIQTLSLDPLKEEIGFTQYEDGNWQVLITVYGCSKVLNQHSQFNGLLFNQADTLVEGVPEWMECTIYRKDRVLPITIREYFIEVKGNSEIWQKMPRRMLRHRVLQQCVRLAMG